VHPSSNSMSFERLEITQQAICPHSATLPYVSCGPLCPPAGPLFPRVEGTFERAVPRQRYEVLLSRV
jgi:hypothetical protein